MFQKDSPQATAEANAAAIAQLTMLNQLIELTALELDEALRADE